MEVVLHFLKDLFYDIDMEFTMVFIEDFNKPAHMGSAESMGQTNIHVNGTHGMLDFIGPIQNSDGIPKVFYTNAIHRNFALVPLALQVDHRLFLLFVFGTNDGFYITPGIEVAGYFHPSGTTNGYQVIQDFIDGLFVEYLLIPEWQR